MSEEMKRKAKVMLDAGWKPHLVAKALCISTKRLVLEMNIK